MSLIDIANETQDVVDTKAGSGDFKPPREGVALLRLCSLIELGTYAGEWKGKAKENKKVLIEFELVHPDHKIIGNDGSFKGYHRVMVRVNKSGHVKSKYMALFNNLNYDGTVHFEKDTIPALSRFLGHAFLGTIYHNLYKEKVYANLDKDGVYSIGAPRSPLTNLGMPTGEYEDIPVPEMNVKPKLFMWEAPGMPDSGYKSMWASLYIEGEKDDGSSKNWIQDLMLSAENIALPGSKVEELFLENGELSDLSLGDPSLA